MKPEPQQRHTRQRAGDHRGAPKAPIAPHGGCALRNCPAADSPKSAWERSTAISKCSLATEQSESWNSRAPRPVSTATSSRHDHLRCVRCGRVDDIHGPPLDLVGGTANDLCDYRILGHRVEVLGICPQCQAEKGPESGGDPSVAASQRASTILEGTRPSALPKTGARIMLSPKAARRLQQADQRGVVFLVSLPLDGRLLRGRRTSRAWPTGCKSRRAKRTPTPCGSSISSTIAAAG